MRGLQHAPRTRTSAPEQTPETTDADAEWHPAGLYVHERFKPGALTVPTDDVLLVNHGHVREKVAGHLTSVRDVGGEVHVSGVLVDTVTDGHEAAELARAGSVRSLSVEFMSLGAPFTTVTRDASGGQLVEHSKVLLVGCALVAQPAYRSARLTRLLDRREAAREREGVRQRHLSDLAASGRRAEVVDARVRVVELLGRTRAGA